MKRIIFVCLLVLFSCSYLFCVYNDKVGDNIGEIIQGKTINSYRGCQVGLYRCDNNQAQFCNAWGEFQINDDCTTSSKTCYFNDIIRCGASNISCCQ